MGWTKCKAFTMTVKGDIEKILADVKKLAKSEGVDFKGDAKKGSFINKDKDVKGTYTIDGKKITMNTDENMWVGTCSMVQDKIRGWFKGK